MVGFGGCGSKESPSRLLSCDGEEDSATTTGSTEEAIPPKNRKFEKKGGNQQLNILFLKKNVGFFSFRIFVGFFFSRKE